MISHNEIWRGIDRLASSFGYSPSGLAKKAGLDPTSFNKSKRISPDGKPRWPSTESLSRVLSATGSTMTDFISLVGVDEQNNNKKAKRQIPLIGLAQAGRKGFFDEDGYPAGNGWDEVALPSGETDSHAYALKVSGNSMEPLYRAGDILVVSPGARIKRGDRVVVKTRGGEVMAKELIKQSPAKIELKSLNPDAENLSFNANQVTWMARIVWVSQ
jgi:phage repressor protein C with HTH and peptisase S24 domain